MTEDDPRPKVKVGDPITDPSELALLAWRRAQKLLEEAIQQIRRCIPSDA